MDGVTVGIEWAAASDFADRIDDLQATLSEDERERADRFRVETARRSYVVGRAMARAALARATGTAGADLRFVTGDHGKPFLVRPETDPPLRFNLSHSRDIVTLAIAEIEIGIDVEVLRPVKNAAAMARRFFSEAERDAVLSAEGGARDRAFLRIWTQKEAYLKATGLGVGMPLREVETEPDPAAPPRLFAIGGDRSEAAPWAMTAIEIPSSVCTIATLGGVGRIEVRRVAVDELEAVFR